MLRFLENVREDLIKRLAEQIAFFMKANPAKRRTARHK
jgi:hypothetical protein